jgi:WD40 repeat protein
MSRVHIHLEVRSVGPNGGDNLAGPQWFAVRCGGGPVHPVRLRWEDGWRTDLQKLHRQDDAADVLGRLGIRLMRLLSATGWPREAARIREARDRGDEIHLSVVTDTPAVLQLPWEALPVGDGGAPLVQILAEPISYSLPGAGIRPARTIPHPDGGRLLVVACGGDEVLRAGLRTSLGTPTGRPARELLEHPDLHTLTDTLGQGNRRSRPVTMVHLVTQVEERAGTLMVQLGGEGSDAEWVRDRDLVDVLSRHADTIRVIALTLTGPPDTDLSALPRALHRAGVATVVSPRSPFSTAAIVPWNHHLHDALIDKSLAVHKAVGHAASRLQSDGHLVEAAALQVFSSTTSHAAVRPFTFAPFKGLAHYGASDAARFFGRTTETRKLVDLVTALTKQGRPRFVVVAGAPHSGRTSIVEAGLYPALRDRTPGLELRCVDPSMEAMAQLDTALSAPRADDASLLLVVDPLDALLASAEHAGTTRRLVNRLWRLAASGTSRVTVVVVVRVDQLALCGRIVVDDLGASLENLAYDDRHRLFITEPGPRALREIIDRPSQMVDLTMDPDFASTLMRAAARRPGSLREVSLVLDRAWSLREGEVIRGVSEPEATLLTGAFERLSERIQASLPDDTDRAFVATLLRGLIDPDSGAPIPVSLQDVRPAGLDARSRFDRVVRELLEHAVLVEHHTADRRWLVLRLPELLELWPVSERPTAPVPAPPPVKVRSRPSRSRSSAAWIAALLLFSASGAGLFGWWGQKSHQRTQAADRFEAATRAANDPTTAAVLLRQIPPMLRPEGWTAAANAALQSAQAEQVLHFSGANVQQLGFSPDGNHLLVRVDGRVQVLVTGDSPTPMRTIQPKASDGGVVAATFSPSGVKVVTVARSGRVQAWPIAGGPPEDIAPAVEQDTGVVAAFSPRSSHLVRVWGNTVQVHDIDGNAIKSDRIPDAKAGGVGTPCCAVVDDDGERWAVGTEEGRILLYERDKARPKRLRLEGLRRFHLNRGGTHLLALGDGTLRIVDMVRGTGSNRTPTSVRVDAAVFSPDGRHIAVDYLDRDTNERHSRSVSVSSRREQLESPKLDGRATALAASGGGEVLLRAADGVISELDVQSGVRITEYRGHGSPIRELRQSDDGTWMASSALDGSVRVWRRSGERPSLVSHPPRELMGADPFVFTPDGAAVGGVTADGRFAVASLEPGVEMVDLGEAPGPVQLLRISSDGRKLAAVDAKEMLHVRDGTSAGNWSRALPGPVVALSPRLDTLLVRDGRRGVAYLALDQPDRHPEPLPVPSENVSRAAFDPEGRFLALGFENGAVHLFDAASSAPLGELEQSEGRVSALCISPDGQNAVVGTARGSLTLWSPRAGTTTPLIRNGPIPRTCHFSSDDQSLVVQYGTDAEVWSLTGPDPRRLIVAPTRRPAGGKTAHIDTKERALVTLGADGHAHGWLLDADDIHARLWQSTSTCSLAEEEPSDLKRWCACEACFGRTPDACTELSDDPLTADLDRLASWCPAIPDEQG